MVQTQTLGGIGGGESNIGYIAEMWLIDVADVLGLAPPVLTQAGLQFPASAVSLTAPAVLTNFKFGAKACTGNYEAQRSEAGISYAIVVSGNLPKPNPLLLGWLMLNARRRWLVIYRDRNGQMWLGGKPDEGWRMAWKHDTADRNLLELSITGLNTRPPFRLTESTLVAMFPDGEFDCSFDFSFNS